MLQLVTVGKQNDLGLLSRGIGWMLAFGAIFHRSGF
jgi:hypothetical protein